MVPRKFNIVEFDGFDLAGQYGEALPGIYDKIVDAHWNCVYIMCFGLKFAGFDIAPQYMTPEMFSDHIMLNGIISIDQNDVITIPGIEPPVPPPEPVILPGIFEENGTFTPPSGVDGYAPVTVNVSGGGGDIVYVPYDPEYEQGAVNGNSVPYADNKVSSTTRIRPVNIVNVSQFVNDTVLFVWDESQYDITIQQYDGTGYARVIHNPWFTTAMISKITYPNIVIPIKKKSGEAITPSEFASVNLKLISLTDSVF